MAFLEEVGGKVVLQKVINVLICFSQLQKVKPSELPSYNGMSD
jgi:hypothetical protein